MPQIIEMKKDAFLKKIGDYATRKKEKPTKLSATPASLSIIKVKFIFAKTHEIILKPQDVSFFKKNLMGKATPAKATDTDVSKTYYFSFCAPLLKELTKAKIYAGKSAGEKLEALGLYLNAIKDDKIILEVIPNVDLTITNITPNRDEEEKNRGFIIEDDTSCSQSFIEDTGVESSGKEEGRASHEDAFHGLFEEGRRRIEEQEFTIQGLKDKIQSYETLVRKSELKIKKSKIKIKEGRFKDKESSLEIEKLKETVQELYTENLGLKALQGKNAQDKESGDGDSLAPQYDLKFIGESPTWEALNRIKARELWLFCEGDKLYCRIFGKDKMEITVDGDAPEASEKGLCPPVFDKISKMARDSINPEVVNAAVQQGDEHQQDLAAFNDDRAYERLTEGETGALFEFLALCGYAASNQDGGIEYDDGINDLIGDLGDQETNASLHLSEVITQWNNMLLWSRNEPVTVQVYNRDADADEEQTLARFTAIARLEREKAAHFANSDNPWPKEEELASIKSDGYGFDLKCLSLYQDFPPALKQFAVLFAFWEAAHHNRFYRNALSVVLNGGNVPDALGIADADPTDTMLKLLHYADMTRILMGHYGYIAQHQFDRDLFVTQDENIARLRTGLFGNAEGDLVNISRITTEDTVFM